MINWQYICQDVYSVVWVSHADWHQHHMCCVAIHHDGGVDGDAMTANADLTVFSIESSNHLSCVNIMH